MKKEIYETFNSERYFFLTLIFKLIYDILEKGFFLMERNWWNIYFDNWVNHSYLANMYVCSTTWLKITVKHSSDIFFL